MGWLARWEPGDLAPLGHWRGTACVQEGETGDTDQQSHFGNALYEKARARVPLCRPPHRHGCW